MRARALVEAESAKEFILRIGKVPSASFSWDSFDPDADIDELHKWVAYIGNGRCPRAAANRWFPGKPGRVLAVRSIRGYLGNVITAKRLRLEGNVEVAQHYERIADSIYSRLPDYARW